MAGTVHPRIQAVINSGCKDLELLQITVPGNFIFSFFDKDQNSVDDLVVYMIASLCTMIRGENRYTKDDVSALMAAIANRPQATIIDFPVKKDV